MSGSTDSQSADLPFLVTHWLSNYGAVQTSGNEDSEEAKKFQQDAIERIRKATNDLSAAFADLGAFGVTLNTPMGALTQWTSDKEKIETTRNANYTDLSRRWNDMSNRQLESLVATSRSATTAVINSREGKASVLDSAYEREKTSNNTVGSAAMRNILENRVAHQQNVMVPSILQRPVLLQRLEDTSSGNGTNGSPSNLTLAQEKKDASVPTQTRTKMAVGSDFKRVECLAAQASKRYLTIHSKFQEEEKTMRQIHRSLAYQKRVQKGIENEVSMLLTNHCASADPENADNQRSQSNELAQKKLENERIIAQLGRRLEEIVNIHTLHTKTELNWAKSVAETFRRERIAMGRAYIDPTKNPMSCFHNDWKLHGRKANSIINHVVGRSYGVALKGKRGSLRKRIGMNFSEESIMQRNKMFFLRRLSHCITINSHLFCPVYCLRFDRTGRYFVTGADDNLVKLFRLGSAFKADAAEKQKYNSLNPDFSYQRGAILVCTLRGHAGVITDIDVSSDNALLATASEDGDVRVWGMSDGCPVAILRGHEGGANMVSWSSMTPYQLVTIAGDGLARTWDVREAALKRCKNVRKRRDYSTTTKSSVEEPTVDIEVDSGQNIIEEPPFPSLLENGQNREEEPASNEQPQHAGVYVPPLPAGAEHGVGAEAAINNGNRNNGPIPGTFVASNEIDEGVILLARLQHGDLPESSQFQGAGTRSRRKKVKVICISSCPIGGHFATGSDDGIGRIWLDDANEAIENLDKQNIAAFDNGMNDWSLNLSQNQIRDSFQRTRASSRGSNNAPSSSSLLASLHGHHNEITDVKYSNVGDRLITASQKDGVVRVWSWGSDGSMKMDQIKQIFIRMEPPPQFRNHSVSNGNRTAPTSRRRGGNSTSQNGSICTQCDVATWTSDDSKIITSQSCVAKASDTEIIPGTHILYVWDSRSGNCLIGLPGAHEKPCLVLFSHPLDSSIIVSAGADGHAKVWDLDVGECVFSHCNTHNYGAIENLTDRGKVCAYLDGSFSPDGLHLVLTDDTGRITVLDVLTSEEGAKDRNNGTLSALSHTTDVSIDMNDDVMPPTWMQEQYFANDYYDLFYDANGYCIERGSRLPPHIAPEAARCMHTGHPYADSIQLAFVGIEGPMPLLEDVVFEEREKKRQNSAHVRKSGGVLVRNVTGKRHLIEARANTASHLGKNTFTIQGNSSIGCLTQSASPVSPARRSPAAARTAMRNMSSNYRWIGFDEMEREDDDDEAESDDDEYQEGNMLREDGVYMDAARPSRGRQRNMDNVRVPSRGRQRNMDAARPSRGRQRNRSSTQRSRRQQVRNRARSELEELENIIQNEPTRVSARSSTRRNDNQYVYESDESDLEEMLSANTNPVGEYIKDYTDLGHLYKLPNGGAVNRKWVTREDCVLGYTGWKTYCPQVGDKVVYIPRAHAETLKSFPVCETATGAPWKSWPKSSAWPMVECKVQNIRYRFPYSGYFGSRARTPISSVVAILTLELIGIPLHTHDRTVPWLQPEFVPRPATRSSSSMFEVSIFENGESDFILPLELYKWRIECLQRSIAEETISSGIELVDFYMNTENEDAKFDPFSCELFTTNPDQENELHFQGSGYNSIHIKYETSDESWANSWDVTVRGAETKSPLPSRLTDAQSRGVVEILDKLESDLYVKATFSAPVDERRFVDYSMMIEVPMDTSIIRRRLRKHYYTNVYSVLADMKLIRDNCFKYNKMGSEITEEAKKLFETFSSLFEEKLDILGNEPCERKSSAELDNAVRSISTNRRSSRLRDSHSDAPVNGSADNNTGISYRSSQTGRLNARGDVNDGVARRSVRANQRSVRSTVDAAEEPHETQQSTHRSIRIRLSTNRRRQAEYLSEEDSESEEHISENSEIGENSESEADSGREMGSTHFKVLVGGEEYSVSSESTNDEESLATITSSKRHPKENGVSDDDEDMQPVVEQSLRRSRRQSSRITQKTTEVASPLMEDDTVLSDVAEKPQESRRGTRRSTRLTYDKDDASSVDIDQGSLSSEETNTSIPERHSRRRNSPSMSASEATYKRQTTRASRSSSRRQTEVQGQVQSLQETFTRRISARAAAQRITITDELPTVRTPGRRSSRVPSTTLENLPPSTTLENPLPSSPGGTRISRRQRANVTTYHDYSNSEFEDDESDPEEEEEEAPIEIRRTRKRSRQMPASSARKAKKPKRKEEIKLPQLEKWPGHIVKPHMMHDVCIELIGRVETFDAEGLFHKPVIENFPEIAEKYFEKVETPMDLTTIRNQRMDQYRVISELQDDLILIFRNCCAFNPVRSQYWKYAVEIWENLNQIFIDTLKEKGLDLPRRFST